MQETAAQRRLQCACDTEYPQRLEIEELHVSLNEQEFKHSSELVSYLQFPAALAYEKPGSWPSWILAVSASKGDDNS